MDNNNVKSQRVIQIDKYYTATKHLLDIYEKGSRKMAFNAKSIAEYKEWKNKLRNSLKEITGINRMQTCELSPVLIETKYIDGYRRDKIVIQTEPDVWMPFYMLVPDDVKPNEKRPCMIAPHGHVSGGKFSTAGRTDIDAVKEAIEKYNYDYGIKFVKQGYMTFCSDARGFGERREWMKQSDKEEDFMTSTCIPLNHMAVSLGQSLTGMWTWDLMRLIDYIETRNDCDAGRIGCGGLSGGALQTLWLSALDDRIKCSVLSGYFYGYKDSLLKMSNNCGCNYIPGLWEIADMCDIGALIAPRPLLVETGDMDSLNGERGIANVTEQIDITKEAYKLFGASDKLYHHVFAGEHLWNGEKTYDFINKHLKR